MDYLKNHDSDFAKEDAKDKIEQGYPQGSIGRKKADGIKEENGRLCRKGS